LLPRPGDGARGGAREFARRDPAADGEIVIAGDADTVGAADQRDAGGGVAIITDDIAEADDAVDRALGDVASSASRLAWMSEMSASLTDRSLS
jgi:hypothetical protein